jgi:hypothetical protein
MPAMVRTQIQLKEEQAERVAELIRISVDQLLGSAPVARNRDELRARARGLAGRFSSGVSDLAAGHDKHLSKIYGK